MKTLWPPEAKLKLQDLALTSFWEGNWQSNVKPLDTWQRWRGALTGSSSWIMGFGLRFHSSTSVNWHGVQHSLSIHTESWSWIIFVFCAVKWHTDLLTCNSPPQSLQTQQMYRNWLGTLLVQLQTQHHVSYLTALKHVKNMRVSNIFARFILQNKIKIRKEQCCVFVAIELQEQKKKSDLC